nr:MULTISPECIES: excalibur calcium-binding domain-containing protein [unclassified Sphingomonas]
MLISAFAAISIWSLGHDQSDAHGGGLNKDGCHHDRKGGTGYHCHRGPSAQSGRPANRPRGFVGGDTNEGRAFANCSAARAAGAAPVRVGDAGYGRHLDRDGDGVGCE